MKSRLLALAIALALSPFAANADIYTVTYGFSVPNNVPWMDTGIDVGAGNQLTITATGSVVYGPFAEQVTDANGGDFTGQQFFPTAVYPTTIIVSLIGKTGGDTTIGTGTPLPEGTPGKGPGFVGTSYNQIVLTGGRLFLGFNDQTTAFGDNSGAFYVNVTVVPEPTVPALLGLGALALWLKRQSA